MLTRYRRTTPTANAFARDPFVQFVDRFFGELASPATTYADEATVGWTPAMDIVETDDAFLATVDLPGLTKDDIDLSLEDGVLSISGERSFEHTADDESKGFRRVERSFGSFRRAFTLPQGVDVDRLDATFADGVLKLTLPKSEVVKARKITIS